MEEKSDGGGINDCVSLLLLMIFNGVWLEMEVGLWFIVVCNLVYWLV